MLNSTLEKILNYLKLVGLAIPFFGIYFIVNYFIQNKIPLPDDVGSTLFLVPVIAIGGLLIVVYSLLGVFMPSVFLDWTGINLKPLFYSDDDYPKLRLLISRYMLLYGGVIAFMFSVGFFPAFFNGSSGTYGWGFIIVLIHALLVFAHLKLDKRLLFMEAGKLFSYVVLTSIIFLIWFCFVVILMLRAIGELFPRLSEMSVFWIIFIPMLLLHFCQTVFYSKVIDDKPQQRNKLIIGLFFVAILSALQPTVASYIGKATLYFFGMGGGKPVHVYTNGFKAEKMPAWLKEKEGDSAIIYLMFKSPGNIYLREAKDSKVTDKMSLKDVRRIEYLSGKDSDSRKIEFIDHTPAVTSAL